MDLRRRAGDADGFAQESGFFTITFNKMDDCAGPVRQCAGDRDGGKSTARAEVNPDPCVWRQIEQLKRIGNVTCPNRWDSRRRDQIGFLLPNQ